MGTGKVGQTTLKMWKCISKNREFLLLLELNFLTALVLLSIYTTKVSFRSGGL